MLRRKRSMFILPSKVANSLHLARCSANFRLHLAVCLQISAVFESAIVNLL